MVLFEGGEREDDWLLGFFDFLLPPPLVLVALKNHKMVPSYGWSQGDIFREVEMGDGELKEAFRLFDE